MRICKKCKHTYNDSTELCPDCKRRTSIISEANTPVYLMSASGFELQRIQSALEDCGIPSDKMPQKRNVSSNAVTGYDISEYDILVPFSAYEQAYDVCVGIGAIKLDDENVIEDGDFVPTNDGVKSAGENFEEMSGTKRTTVKVVSAILLLLVFSVVIIGVDQIMQFLVGLFK